MSEKGAFGNFAAMWSAVCVRYPEFIDPEHLLRQRSRGLERLLQQAWDEAYKNGRHYGGYAGHLTVVIPPDFDSFPEMWAAVCERYPAFKDPDYILQQRSRGLRRLLEQAWKSAESRGHALGKTMADLKELQRKHANRQTDSFLDSFLSGRFGS